MKKYIVNVSFAKIAIFIFMLFTSLVNAQTETPDEATDDVVVPIGDYVWILALVGLIYVFFKFTSFVKQGSIKANN